MEHPRPFKTEASARACAIDMGLVDFRIVIRDESFLVAAAGGRREWVQNTHYFIVEGV